MAPRATWKGFLTVGQVSCPISLYPATSTSERIAFHTINRATGHRVRRIYVDSETGKAVEREDQIKGYMAGPEDIITLEPNEISAVVPTGDKTLAVAAFISCHEIDKLYFDRPYFLAPSDRHAEEAYVLIREGLRAGKVAALAEAVLFRRLRKVLIWPDSQGLVATMLNFAYEVRPAATAFDDLPDLKIEGEMLDLARHIIETKRGKFDPSAFQDRYETALAELVKAKIEGRPIERPAKPGPEKVVDLMAALRESAVMTGAKKPAAKSRTAAKRGSKRAAGTTKAATRRKAG